MANNLFANTPAAVIARENISFLAAGITAQNTNIIYLIESPLKSYIPGNTLNTVSDFVFGKGYYIIPKTNMDLSAVLIPPIPVTTSSTTTSSSTTTTTTVAHFNAYWGYSDTNTPFSNLSQVQAASSGSVNLATGADVIATYSNTVGKYLWLVLPTSEAARTGWDASTVNQFNKNSIPGTLFGNAINIGNGLSMLITNYKTQISQPMKFTSLVSSTSTTTSSSTSSTSSSSTTTTTTAFVPPPSNVAGQNVKVFGDGNSEYQTFQNIQPIDRYVNQVGNELGISVSNYANMSTTIHTPTYGLSDKLGRASESPMQLAIFQYGNNDAKSEVINSQWKADYKSYIQTFINNGHPTNKIVLITPMYKPNLTDSEIVGISAAQYNANLLQVTNYIIQIASELSVILVDLYNFLKNSYLFDVTDAKYINPNTISDNYALLQGKGHRILADRVKLALVPPTYTGGTARVKLFGSGSAMAGTSSWMQGFVQKFGEKSHRNPTNYAIAGTGVFGSGDPTFLDAMKTHANDGQKDIAIFLYGNNDGGDSPTWKSNYKAQIQYFIDNGYALNNLMIMTVTKHISMQTDDVNNWNRIEGANTSIRQIASEMGIRLLDIEQIYSTGGNWYADYYHLNDTANNDLSNRLVQIFGTV